MWDYSNYSRINNCKFPLRKRNNLERSSLQDNKIRRSLRSISIITFFKIIYIEFFNLRISKSYSELKCGLIKKYEKNCWSKMDDRFLGKWTRLKILKPRGEREMAQKRQRFDQRFRNVFETLIRNTSDISKGIKKRRKINSSGRCSNLVKSFVAGTTYFTIVVGNW